MDDALLRGLVALPFGLVIGSFMTVAAHRIPKKESLVGPRSRCPSCGATIGARDNIPVLSWLLLRGRCRHCRAPISAEYPLIELSTAGLVVLAAVRYPDPWQAIVVGGLLAMMPALTLIDLRHQILPNRLTYPALVLFPLVIVLGWALGGDLEPLKAAVGLVLYGGGIFLIALISKGMGLGDVKLAAVLGLALGALGLRFVGAAAGATIVLGGLGGLVALLMGRGMKSKIPYGPYLAAGAVVAGLWGEAISSWYIGRFL